MGNGELLLNLAQFVCVAVLGFLPLIVVHWADRRPRLRFLRTPLQALAAFKTALMVVLAEWLESLTV